MLDQVGCDAGELWDVERAANAFVLFVDVEDRVEIAFYQAGVLALVVAAEGWRSEDAMQEACPEVTGFFAGNQ